MVWVWFLFVLKDYNWKKKIGDSQKQNSNIHMDVTASFFILSIFMLNALFTLTPEENQETLNEAHLIIAFSLKLMAQQPEILKNFKIFLLKYDD